MKLHKPSSQLAKLLLLGVCSLAIGILSPQRAHTEAGGGALSSSDFVNTAPQGFGDRQNSVTWSMAWFKDRLYVGTGRALECVRVAVEHAYYPIVKYPPEDPDVQCAPDPADLPLQAEIWRWTPESGNWDRVYQSPNDVAIPNRSGKYTARDIGYRGMLVFTEADGTEALYISGVSLGSLYPGVPAPRILRTTDGVNFQPLPQDPGTFLHDIDATGFRGLTQYKGRLFVLASVGLLGQGYIIESNDPKAGNNSFHTIMPDNLLAYEMTVFNNQLYIGSASRDTPFIVWKTDASGVPPYNLVPVLTNGGNRRVNPSKTVVSMQVFHDDLFVGTDRPPDLFRIHADNTWQLIVGSNYPSQPLSGIGSGFDWPYNLHVWRMGVYNDRLLVGTMDSSTGFRNNTIIGPLVKAKMGFDIFTSADGEHMTVLTQNGLGDPFNVGVRQLVSTPYGLFLGDENPYNGHTIFRVVPGMQPRGYFPLVFSSGTT